MVNEVEQSLRREIVYACLHLEKAICNATQIPPDVYFVVMHWRHADLQNGSNITASKVHVCRLLN